MIVKSLFDASDPGLFAYRIAAAALLLTVWLCCGTVILADDAVSYDQVREILRKRCVTCHNPDEMRGDLDLKDLSAIRTGSSSGAVIVPGDPSKSLLFTTIAHLEDPVMPPNSRQLPAREQDLIRRWIAGGAVELAATGPAPNTAAVAKSTADSAMIRSPAMSSLAQALGLVAIRSLPQPTAVTALDAHPTRDLAAFNGLRQAVLFEPSSGKLPGALDVPSGEVNADVGPILTVARSSQWLAAAGRQGALSTWSMPDVAVSTLKTSKQIESLVPTHDGQLLLAADAAGQISILNAANLEVLHVVQLPVDARALEQILAKIELVSQDFASRIQNEKKIAAETKGSATPSSLTELLPSEQTRVEDAGTVPAPHSLAAYLAEEIDRHQRQLRSLESSLQVCNESLAVMAQASADLSRTLQQIAETQQNLAKQVTLQTQLLRDCQERSAQLSAALNKASDTK